MFACQMSNVNKVEILSERISGVPRLFLALQGALNKSVLNSDDALLYIMQIRTHCLDFIQTNATVSPHWLQITIT